MDTTKPIGKPPQAETKAVADVDDSAAGLLEMQRLAVVALLIEVIQNTSLVGVEKGGDTVYLLHLSTVGADTLAALAADLKIAFDLAS